MYVYPASITKIMTTCILFKLLREDIISYEDNITITRESRSKIARGENGTYIFMNDNKKNINIRDIIKGILVASGNDACYCLEKYLKKKIYF